MMSWHCFIEDDRMLWILDLITFRSAAAHDNNEVYDYEDVIIINNCDDDDDGSLKASLIWHLFRSAAPHRTTMRSLTWVAQDDWYHIISYKFEIFESISFIRFNCSPSISWGHLTFSLKILYVIFLSMATAHCVEHELHWLISKADTDASFLD